MSLHAARVEIAWDSGFSTAEGSRTWTDVSSYVEGQEDIGITYGRSDELSAADPNTCSLTLDNRDGRFTPGKSSGAYYPNVKKGKPLRVSLRYTVDGAGNFLTANNASFETSVAGWSAAGTVVPTLAQSATHADVGSNAMRITWGTGGTGPAAQTTVTGLVVGRAYTAQARVWVTSGTPDIRLGVTGISNGTATSTKSAFAAISYTFTATANSHVLQVQPATAPTSGQQCWVDAVMVDEGSAVGTFTTSAPPIYTRFMGYVNEWPVVWPDGSSAASTVTISASSRRARMGQTAPLTSAIRAAYFASEPDAYWPMDEDTDTTDRTGRQAFRDVTNVYTPGFSERQPIAAFFSTAAAPIVRDGTQGPTDEQSLVKLPSFTNGALTATFPHYVGAGNAINVNTAGAFTVEVVSRLLPIADTTSLVVLDIMTADRSSAIQMGAASSATGAALVGQIYVNDASTGASIDSLSTFSTTGYTPADYAIATDGQIHHYAVTLSGTSCKAYFDGALFGTMTLSAPVATRYTNIAFGEDSYNGDIWVGHGAVYDRALTADEVLAHAQAATAASETDGERVARVAGRIGVPADEVDVETSIALLLGPQAEAGRSASEVIDEVAASTRGIAYDKRSGHFALQARQTRYNTTAAFTLSAVAQEVEGDLTAKADDRYLLNTVEFTRVTADAIPSTTVDQDSIDEYGVYSTSLSIVSSSDQEVEAAAQDILYRFADGGATPRISQVSVNPPNLSDAQRRLILAADIGTKFALGSLAEQAPADPMNVFFEGATESITATSHTMTINTTPGDLYTNVWVCDVNDLMDSGIVVGY